MAVPAKFHRHRPAVSSPLHKIADKQTRMHRGRKAENKGGLAAPDNNEFIFSASEPGTLTMLSLEQ